MSEYHENVDETEKRFSAAAIRKEEEKAKKEAKIEWRKSVRELEKKEIDDIQAKSTKVKPTSNPPPMKKKKREYPIYDFSKLHQDINSNHIERERMRNQKYEPYCTAKKPIEIKEKIKSYEDSGCWKGYSQQNPSKISKKLQLNHEKSTTPYLSSASKYNLDIHSVKSLQIYLLKQRPYIP